MYYVRYVAKYKAPLKLGDGASSDKVFLYKSSPVRMRDIGVRAARVLVRRP